MDQHDHAYASWSSWQEALTQDWSSSSGAAPASAQQQGLSVKTGSDTCKIVYSQYTQERSVKTGPPVEQGEQVYGCDQHLHNTVGQNPTVQFQIVFPMLRSWIQSASSLLGAMAALLDDIASGYVFGAIGTTGRPRGYITLHTICTMDDDNKLNKSQRPRWLQFLQVWKSAGWGCSDMVLLTEELRPLQYGHPQILKQIGEVDANEMLKCISIYSNSQGHRRFKLKESLIRFLNVVQKSFSSPKTVLLCDPDVNARLSKVQVMDDCKC